jgi:hypothetical protein
MFWEKESHTQNELTQNVNDFTSCIETLLFHNLLQLQYIFPNKTPEDQVPESCIVQQ